MKTGSLSIMLVTLVFSLSSFAAIEDMTQTELKQALARYSRCSLEPTNSFATGGGKTVSMIQAMADDGDSVYFAEVTFPDSPEKIIYYLSMTHLTMGGYKSVGERDYYFGLSVSGSVNFLSQMNSGSGVDASITISSSTFSSEESFYNYCEF